MTSIPIDDLHAQYITSLYFVTTTVTTCGFGDFYAVHYDDIEVLSVTALQFVGLLFYSYTIDKIQSLMTSGEIPAHEYASQMSDVVENLIVKCAKFV